MTSQDRLKTLIKEEVKAVLKELELPGGWSVGPKSDVQAVNDALYKANIKNKRAAEKFLARFGFRRVMGANTYMDVKTKTKFHLAQDPTTGAYNELKPKRSRARNENVDSSESLVEEELPELTRDQAIQQYSDMYKDLYGVRPRHMNWDSLSTDEIVHWIDELAKQEPTDVTHSPVPELTTDDDEAPNIMPFDDEEAEEWQQWTSRNRDKQRRRS